MGRQLADLFDDPDDPEEAARLRRQQARRARTAMRAQAPQFYENSSVNEDGILVEFFTNTVSLEDVWQLPDGAEVVPTPGLGNADISSGTGMPLAPTAPALAGHDEAETALPFGMPDFE